MSQNPILTIRRGETSCKKITANLLPCRVHHTGPVDPVAAYWTPESTKGNNGNNKTAYLRGRKLNGKAVTLPEAYRGVVLRREDENRRSEQEELDMQIAGNRQEEGNGEEEGPPTGEMRVMAEFDEMVVWAHGDLPDGSIDPYMRSVEEWSQFAAKIHSYEVAGSK